MSYEIRQFLVFVEQDGSFGRPLPDESFPLQFAAALEEHFDALAAKHASHRAASADVDPPRGSRGDSGLK